MANTNRRKGHDAERYYAKQFRDLGWDKCKTCRETSRLKDNCKIDLDFIPFNVQVKAGKQAGMKPAKIFNTMGALLKDNFPKDDPIHNLPKLLIHKKPIGRGKKAKPEDELVYFERKSWKIPLLVAFADIKGKSLDEEIAHFIFTKCISIVDDLVCITWENFKRLISYDY